MDDTKDLSENVNENPSDDESKNAISSDLIRGHINTIILRTLYERDKYGYEILEEIEKKSHGQYTLKQPTLYSALKRLESQGYINAYWKTDEISLGGRRKYYTLTDSGREITERNQAEWEYSRTVIDNLISDRSFDFTQPPPASVDFKLLKKSTSRVPVVKDEYDENDDTEERRENGQPEHNEDKLPEIEINPETAIFKEQTVYYESAPVTIPLEQSLNTSPLAEKPQDSSQTSVNGVEDQTLSEESTIKEEIVQEAPTTVIEEVQEPVVTVLEEGQQQVATVRVEDIVQQPIAPVHINVIVQQPVTTPPSAEQPQPVSAVLEETQEQSDEIINQSEKVSDIEQNQETAFSESTKQEVPFADNSFIDEQPKVEEQTSQDEYSAMNEDERRKVHENYLRLISEPVPEPPKEVDIVPVSDEIDTEKLIYNNKPETERDYRNLINKLFDKTIKRNQAPPVITVPEPEPEQMPRTTTVRIEDISTKAQNDGLKVDSSDYVISTRKRSYNLGNTLFKSSLIVTVLLLLEFMFTLIFRNDLGIGMAYPFVIFAIAAAQLLIFGILYYADNGKSSRKPSATIYFSACIILTVIIIFIIFLIAILLNVDFRSVGDIFAKIIIPILVSLNIPVFACCFYGFTKFN